MDWVLTFAGLTILLLAGDALVKGAVNLSLRLGVPALVVSLTIVAFGTSAPELLISVQAILDGVPELALGNVVGSNTANILIVLGIPAMIALMHTSHYDTRTSYLQMLGATALFMALSFMGTITWIDGLILLAALAAILGHTLFVTLKNRTKSFGEEQVEGADPSMTWKKIIAFLTVGLVGLPLGANLLVEGATNIAVRYGVSDAVIGLTLVAVGTSLPELATTVMASLRRQADVALGNVIGSNMFNLLAIIGLSSLIGDIPVSAEFLTRDLWAMAGASLLLIPFVFFKRDLGRIAGIALTALYLAYLFVLL